MAEKNNTTPNTRMDGTDDADKLTNSGTDVTISGGDGNDTITNTGARASIIATMGENTVINHVGGQNSVIETGWKDDSVTNFADSVSIKSGGRDDTVENSGNYVTVNSGEGDDSVKNNGGNNFVYHFDPFRNGFDVVEGFNDSSTLKIIDSFNGDNIAYANYRKITQGDDVVIKFDRAAVTLKGAANISFGIEGGTDISSNPVNQTQYLTGTSNGENLTNVPGNNVVIDALEGDDTVTNYYDEVTILGGEGNDSIYTSGMFNSVSGGEGKDTIQGNMGSYNVFDGGDDDDVISTNMSEKSTIFGGNGDDSIHAYGYKSSINGGKGNDSIEVDGEKSTADGDAGNDTIKVLMDDATINGGFAYDGETDNDYIKIGDTGLLNQPKNTFIEYVAGSGDDTVEGFNETSILQIGGADYSSSKSGNDIIFKVGTGSITLKDAANLSKLNIDGVEIPSNMIMGTPKKDVLTNNKIDMIINALEDDDSVTNTGARTSINGAEGNDTIENRATNVTIEAGTGDDRVYNYGSLVTIIASEGNNRIYNTKYNDIQAAQNVKIETGNGDDFIQNTGNHVTIDAGNGNNEIFNASGGSDVSIKTGDGNDTIANYAANVEIDAGNGDNHIENGNNGFDTTIKGGSGDDTVINGGDRVSIDAGDSATDYGNNLNNTGNNVTVKGGAGVDVFNNYGDKTSIDTGDGDDTVLNQGDEVTISGGAGNDDIYSDGSDVLIDAGNGKNTVQNVLYDAEGKIISGNNTATILTGNDNDSIVNGGNKSSIDTGDGDDTVLNCGDEVKINTGDGHNAVSNEGDKVTIKGGTGVDAVNNLGDKTSIDTGGGNDFIQNTGDEVTIDAGAGNNEIYNMGDKVTVSGGADVDTVENYGANVLIDAGDGDNQIFNKTLPSSHSDNTEIKTGAGNDYIYNEGNDVTIDAGDGDNDITSYGNGASVKSGTGDDTVVNDGDNVTIDAGNGNNHIDNTFGKNLNIKVGAGDDEIYNSSGDNVTITTGDGNDVIYLGVNAMKVDVTDFSSQDKIQLADSVTNLAIKDGSLVAGAATIGGINVLSSNRNVWRIENGEAIYCVETTAGAILSADGKIITWTDGSYVELLRINGLKDGLTVNADGSIDGITVNDKKIILSAGVLDKSDVTLNNTAYTLELADDCPLAKALSEYWTVDSEKSTATWHKSGMSEGYTTDGKKVTYTPAAESQISVPITGIAKGTAAVNGVIDGLYLNYENKAVIVMPNVLGENFTIPKGYEITFTEGDYEGKTYTGSTAGDMIEIHGDNLNVNGDNGSDHIYGNGRGLTMTGGKGNDTFDSFPYGTVYKYAKGDGYDTIVGDSKNDTIQITDGTTVDVKNFAISGNNVVLKIGNGSITFKDAVENGQEFTVADSDGKVTGHWTYFNGMFVDDNGIGHLPPNPISATASTDGSDLSPQHLDATASKISMKLVGNGEDNSLIGGAKNDTLHGGGGEDTFTGGKGNDIFVLDSGSVHITDYGNGSDKISLGADLKAFDVDDKGTLILQTDGGFVTVQDAAGKTVTFLDGKTSTKAIFTVDGKVNTSKTSITLKSSSNAFTADSTFTTIDGSLTDSVWIVGNTKSNKIFGGDGNDTLEGGKGNDTFTGGKGDDVFVCDSGNDVVLDFASDEDKILLDIADVTKASVKSNGDTILKVNTGQITVKKIDGENPATDGKKITFVNNAGEETGLTFFSDKIIGDGGKVTLNSNYSAKEFKLDENTSEVDASAVSKKLILTGGLNDDTVTGGKSADVINGGAGDDLLIGGNGNDTFVYDSGNDIIADYVSGKDKVSLGSAKIKDYSLDKDITINFDDGSLTIDNATNSPITFVETVNGKVTTQINVFAKDGIFNSKNTAVTLSASTDNYTAASTIVTIDGGLVTDDVEIVGNQKSNVIIAGATDSTINGGKGNDSLWGGAGSDKFIYESGDGKDTIYGFDDNDLLQIGGGTFTAAVNGNGNISFKIGSTTNAVTLKDYTASTFNVNGDTYHIDDGKFIKKTT